jgi:hypothetical protein
MYSKTVLSFPGKTLRFNSYCGKGFTVDFGGKKFREKINSRRAVIK